MKSILFRANVLKLSLIAILANSLFYVGLRFFTWGILAINDRIPYRFSDSHIFKMIEVFSMIIYLGFCYFKLIDVIVLFVDSKIFPKCKKCQKYFSPKFIDKSEGICFCCSFEIENNLYDES